MFLKGLIVVLLATAIVCYEKQGNVLILHDADFPKVIEEHDFIMIEFYAPWCGHCKKLNPIYSEVADELERQGSPVKLAKVDATVDSKWAGQYKVQGYPTIFFFHKGEKLDYNGQRSKQYLVNWLLKKTRDPLVPIDQQTYEKLQTQDKVSIVFHGDASSDEGKLVSKLAVSDDFNTYFVAQVGKPEGSVEIIRPFDNAAIYEHADDKLEGWIRQNQRPPVVSFDDRTIGEMFSQGKSGVCLFNKEGSQALLDAFTESAKTIKASGKQLIFTHIDASSEHLGPFADYIKINPITMPIVLVEAKNKSKFVLAQNPEDLTADEITAFIESWVGGDAKKYGITDEVKIEVPVAEEEQEL